MMSSVEIIIKDISYNNAVRYFEFDSKGLQYIKEVKL